MDSKDDPGIRSTDVESAVRLSRRQALTAAGALVAGTSVGSAGDATAAVDARGAGRPLAFAQQPANAVEFQARFLQTGASGEEFAAFGYLTRVAGATESDLFAGALRKETTALFTAYAEGRMVQRTIDQSVHGMDIVGTLTVYQRASPGASFDTPESFRIGVAVARYDVRLQDILTVILPGKGVPTLNGEMRQTASDGLIGSVTGQRFGHVGSRARFHATGLGTLIDPARLNSVLEMAGNWMIVT